MPIIQLNVKTDNEPGALNRICDILGKDNINIKAVVASYLFQPLQILLIVDDPERAQLVLTSNKYEVSAKEVLAVMAPDHPGALTAILRPLWTEKINIEAIYPFIQVKGEQAILIIDVADIPRTKEVLKRYWVNTLGPEIYRM